MTGQHESSGDALRRVRASTVSQLAHALWDAERAARPMQNWQSIAGDLAPSEAYAVRRDVDVLRMAGGAVPVGRRVSTLVGADGRRQRYWCYLFAGRRRPGWPRLRSEQFIAPQVTAAVGLELAADLPDAHALEELHTVIAALRPVIEILDARTRGEQPWPGTTIADSGRHALLVPGERIELTKAGWRQSLTVRLIADADINVLTRMHLSAHELRDAFDWLAGTAAAMDEPLRQGELIVAGRTSTPQPLLPGRTYWCELAGSGPNLYVAGVHTDMLSDAGSSPSAS